MRFGFHPDIPLYRDPSTRFLPWITAIIFYLSVLSLAGYFLLSNMTQHWHDKVSGSVTIQLPASLEGEGNPQEKLYQEIEGFLKKQIAVESYRLMPREKSFDLLRPWLGSYSDAPNLPIPQLIEVTLKAGQRIEAKAWQEQLAISHERILVDDHNSWLRGILYLAGTLKGAALFILTLILFAAIGIMIFISRTGLAIHSDLIDVLHLMGAQNSYIARQFQYHSFYLSLKGAAFGIIMAGSTLLLIDYFLTRLSYAVPLFESLTTGEWLIGLCLPFLGAVIAAVTTRITVMRYLYQRL